MQPQAPSPVNRAKPDTVFQDSKAEVPTTPAGEGACRYMICGDLLE